MPGAWERADFEALSIARLVVWDKHDNARGASRLEGSECCFVKTECAVNNTLGIAYGSWCDVHDNLKWSLIATLPRLRSP